MVEIIKGSKVLSVPVGAYNNMYAPAGWQLVDKTRKATQKEEPKKNKKEEKQPEPVESQDFEELEDEEDVIYVDPEELNEKPLEELDFDELKILAEYLKINIKGMKSSKAIREAIKKARS